MQPSEALSNSHWAGMAATALLLVYLAVRPQKAAPTREPHPTKDTSRRRRP